MAGLLKVIESAMLMTGDFAGQLLADEGAEVIKVESPFKGDYLRDFTGQFKPHTKGNSPAHVTVNRNKKSVTVGPARDRRRCAPRRYAGPGGPRG